MRNEKMVALLRQVSEELEDHEEDLVRNHIKSRKREIDKTRYALEKMEEEFESIMQMDPKQLAIDLSSEKALLCIETH